MNLDEALIEWDRATWRLAALTLALRPVSSDDALAAAARDLVRGLGIDLDAVPAERRTQLASQASTASLQTAALLSGTSIWAQQTDDALFAQGRASAQAAPMFAQFVVPNLDGLAERLAAPGARMLDVGTGVAALAIAFAEQFPQLEVVGLDVMDRVLALAEQSIAASPASARVTVRQQDVGELDETDAYDLAWIPAPFVPAHAFRRAIPRLAAALRPGGWLMVGHGKFGSDAELDAVNSFKTVAYGGTPLDDATGQELLTAAGLVGVHTAPTPPGAPALTFGRRPPR